MRLSPKCRCGVSQARPNARVYGLPQESSRPPIKVRDRPSVKIVGSSPYKGFVRQSLDMPGLNHNYSLRILQPAYDQKKRFLSNDEAQFLKQRRSHDGV